VGGDQVPPQRHLAGDPTTTRCRLSNLRAAGLARRLHYAGIMKTTTLVGRILFSLLFLMAVPGHFKSETIGLRRGARRAAREPRGSGVRHPRAGSVA